ncbi:MAG TPA: fluoride efflux transporter CrcB [Gemmatimonadaceae bacterium]|jgi:CrcB protein|nr:fluoride efflux transporter CrcB [Gemmatimonadaceae bacterium]
MKILGNIPYVALGAAVGGVLRYVITVYVQGRAGPGFPVATLLINISGALLLGFLTAYLAQTTLLTPQLGLMLTTGVCGGYTTFSTFSYEAFALLRDGEYGRAGAYVALSVLLALGGVIAGVAAARGAINLQRGA